MDGNRPEGSRDSRTLLFLSLGRAGCLGGCCSVAQSRPTLCDPKAPLARLPFTVSQSLLKLKFTESMMPPNYLILCRPLLLLPLIFPSTGVSSSELAFRIRWPKYWNFSFRSSPSNEYSGLVSCKIDWFDLLTVQGTVKSLLQHHN